MFVCCAPDPLLPHWRISHPLPHILHLSNYVVLIQSKSIKYI